MSCTTDIATARLDARYQGDLTDTRIVITIDDVTVDPSTHTWVAELAPAGSTTKTATVSTITADGDDIVIAWTAGDLGACTPGEWWIELTGTQGGKTRPKVRLLLEVLAEIA